jgi:hypothetical protein
MLLQSWLRITAGWQAAFPRQRSFRRAVGQALGTLTAVGRRTLSRSIWARGHQQEDWSAEYKLHARSHWRTDDLFQPVVEHALPWCKGRYVCVAIDDTRLRKTGRRIPTAFYQRDPLSPKFRFNLMLGLRFLQLSLLVPLYRHGKAAPRGLPLRFEEVPAVSKPRHTASQQEWDAFRIAVAQQNLSVRSVGFIRGLRRSLDAAGVRSRKLLIVGDNSFCNRTLFSAQLERTEMLARARRDIRLCRRAPEGSRRVYDAVKFTPEQVRQDDRIGWRKVRIFYAGQWRKIRCKEVTDVLWQSGARQRPLRLIVVAPVPYHVPGRGRPHYRQPAFLLATDLKATIRELLQPYFDRWQIEVNHREEKDTLGVGQAQLRSKYSVPRQPAFAVAAYSALLLAGLLAFGVERGHHYQVLPKWRRKASRPSCLDLVTLLRKEMTHNKALLEPLGIKTNWQSLTLAADA